MTQSYDKIDGVISTTSGYIGGKTANPTYHDVSAGGTGHAESVEIVFDPKRVSYERLLEHFWHTVDPTVKDRQFCDRGDQYRDGDRELDDFRGVAQATHEELLHQRAIKWADDEQGDQ